MSRLMGVVALGIATALSACTVVESRESQPDVTERKKPTDIVTHLDTDDGFVSVEEWEMFGDVYRDKFGYSPDGSRFDAQKIADVACDAGLYMDRSEFEALVTEMAIEGGYSQFEGGFIVGGIMATTCNNELEALGFV